MKAFDEPEEGGHLGEVTPQGKKAGNVCTNPWFVCLPFSPVLHRQPEAQL